jgi:hypothetical protein
MSSEFPNRVRRAMEPPSPGEHPSADVLNAYAEHVLPANEEQPVVQHLATCADCREVVYLASAATEELELPAPTPSPAEHVRWWTWAVPLLAVLIVASILRLKPNLLLMKQTEQATQTSEAKLEKPQLPAESNNAPSVSNPTPVPATTAKSIPEKPSQRTAPRDAVSTLASSRGDLDKGEEAKTPSAEPVFSARNTLRPNAALARKKVEGAPAIEVGGPPAGVAGYSAGTGDGVGSAQPVQSIPQNNTTVEVSAEAPTLNTEQASGQAKAAQLGLANRANLQLESTAAAEVRTTKAEVARLWWRVTPEGRLEHFVNGAWQPALADSGAIFLTVGNFKNDVWAAGKNLALYHSSDNGKHWERQTVPAAGPADIVHIAFTSALNGTLKTSSGSGFSTQDGGRTWMGIHERVTPTP